MRSIVEVALAIIGLAMAGLLITNASKTAQVAQAVGGVFNDSLSVAMGMNTSARA